MIVEVKSKLEENYLMLSGCLLHMRCSAHILNIIVKYGLDVIKDGIEKIRDSVVYWSATPKRVEKFEETAKQLKFSNIRKLILDCSTRWNSTFMMLPTAFVYKDVFSRLRQRESQYKCLPNENDWEFAKQKCEKLKVFYAATEIFSGTKYPIANLFFRKIFQIKLALNQWYFEDDEMISRMASLMIEKYDKYWGVVHELMAIASVLDPRHKFATIEFYFPKIFGLESRDKIEKIRERLSKMLKAYDKSKDENSTDTCEFSKKSYDLSLDDNEYLSFRQSRKKIKVTVMSELDHYLEDEPLILPKENDFDVLLWWKQNGVKFPTLQAIARDIFATPISTVASESAFSTSGKILTPHRSRLHPKTIEALMCAQSWLLGSTPGINSDALDDTINLDDSEDMEITDSIDTSNPSVGGFSS